MQHNTEVMKSYSDILKWLEENNRLLAISADLVLKVKGRDVEKLCSDLFPLVESMGIERTLLLYSGRVNSLAGMMKEFKKTGKYPSNDSSFQCSRETYNVTLLYSYLFSINRFEILEQFKKYLKSLSEAGRIAAIGIGAGYEVKLVCEYLKNWEIEGYEQDHESVVFSKFTLKQYGMEKNPDIKPYFRLEEGVPEPEVYDSIIMIELLEHLNNPIKALKNTATALKRKGTMFVTMAVNIPQEDHVFIYSSIEQCRNQIKEAGLEVVTELYSPSAILPFKDEQRHEIGSGNYIATVKKILC